MLRPDSTSVMRLANAAPKILTLGRALRERWSSREIVRIHVWSSGSLTGFLRDISKDFESLSGEKLLVRHKGEGLCKDLRTGQPEMRLSSYCDIAIVDYVSLPEIRHNLQTIEFSDDDWSGFIPFLLEGIDTRNPKAVPVMANMGSTYFRSDIIEEFSAGSLKTMEGLVNSVGSVSEKAAQLGITGCAFQWFGNHHCGAEMQLFINSCGELLANSKGRMVADRERLLRALVLYRQMIVRSARFFAVSHESEDWSIRRAFRKGRVGCWPVSWPHMMPLPQQQPGPFGEQAARIKAIPTPTLDGKPGLHVGHWLGVIPSYARNKPGAERFLRWFTTSDSVQTRLVDHGLFPVSARAWAELGSHPHYRQFADIDSLHLIRRPMVSGYGAMTAFLRIKAEQLSKHDAQLRDLRIAAAEIENFANT